MSSFVPNWAGTPRLPACSVSRSGSGGSTAGSAAGSTAGSHTITYTIPLAGGCAAVTRTASIVINALPAPTITGLNAAYCKGAAAVTLAGTPTGGTFTVDGTTSTTFSPITLLAGSHTVVYTYTNPANGCVNSTTQAVVINALPTPTSPQYSKRA